MAIPFQIVHSVPIVCPKPDCFNLEFDSAFDDPDTVDVTGRTHYDYTTPAPQGVFRLVRTGY